jgi:hypothetical protein
MTEEARNDGLHPRHPGRGKPASLIELESSEGEPEAGGFMIFLPSGATKVVGWRQAQPIQPTLEAAKEFTAKVVDSLIKANTPESLNDVNSTNWTSVCAAVQRVILDWNGKIQARIGLRMAEALRESANAARMATPRRKH